MNTWLQFLSANGAQVGLEGAPELIAFPTQTTADASSFVAPLTEYGLIAVTGEEAASFLHNQLTNDVEHLGLHEARLAGYCTPKGRLLASFLMWRTVDGIMLMVSRDIQAAVQKRLQMFVLRAKAKLADVTEQHVLLGLSGDTSALGALFPAMPTAPYAKADAESGTLIRVADAFDAPRYLWVADVDTAQRTWPTLTANLAPVGSNAWKLADIRAGIPHITQATQEQFVPQMVNFDVIGGVNFKKGCYPGQEIVARTHYLGKVKRRMLLASTEVDDVKTGSEIFSSAEPEQPCGMVVNAARNAQGGADCLIEIKSALASEGAIHVGSIDGPLLRFAPLPYALPDNE